MRGFTLVEVLVASAVLALLAWMAWQGVSTLARTEDHTRQHSELLASLHAGLQQWSTDLDAAQASGWVPAFAHDGRTTRLTRRAAQTQPLQDPGLQVIAWTVRDGQWQRWASPPVADRDALRQAWDAAQRWGQRASDADRALTVSLAPASQWQIFVHRDGTWTNPLSAPAAETAGGDHGLPEGVRLILRAAAPSPLQGELVRDWVRPTRGGGKSA